MRLVLCAECLRARCVAGVSADPESHYTAVELVTAESWYLEEGESKWPNYSWVCCFVIGSIIMLGGLVMFLPAKPWEPKPLSEDNAEADETRLVGVETAAAKLGRVTCARATGRLDATWGR